MNKKVIRAVTIKDNICLFCHIMMMVVCLSCAGPTNTQSAKQSQTFVLPEIPVMLNTPEQRAKYLAVHYWDNFDFADTTLIDSTITEQAFADYINILPHTTRETAKESIVATIDKALNGSQAMYDRLTDLFDKYLDHPNSPVRNEELYVLVLESQIGAKNLDELYKIRPRARLEMALKNRITEKATNFEYTLANGSKQYMHGITAEYLILFFNNPDCHDCARVKELLLTISNKQARVLAIYADEDIELWKKSKYPSDWINGYSSSVRAKELYDLRAIPNLYLLDKHKRVILKDTPIETLVDYLNKH